MPVKRLTTAEAAERLRTSPRQVIAMIRQGRIPAKRFGRAWQIEERDLLGVSVGPRGRPLKSACVRGHLFTPENTLVYSTGARGCRICIREHNRRVYREKKEGRYVDKGGGE